MIRAHAAEDVRAAEEPLLAAGEPLMASAAFAVATEVLRELRRRGRVSGSTVLLLVGGGNNGGDALVAGPHLLRRGCQVHAALLSGRPHAAGLAAARAGGVVIHDLAGDGENGAGRAGDPVGAVLALARRCGVWVDGLTGIGARGGLREPLAGVVRALARERASWPEEPLVVAVDVPSGIGVDDGTVPGPVLPADVTVTMGTAKPGLLLPPAARLAGRVAVVDLGLDLPAPAAVTLTGADVADLWPVPGPEDHKYTRGVLGVAAGSTTYPGAAVLCTAGALGAGLGMVRYLGPDVPAGLVRAAHPEVVAVPGRVQAWVLGPGVDPADDERAGQVAEHLSDAARERRPAVLDAGALTLLVRDRPALTPAAVLTPHAGELAELLTGLGENTGRDDVDAEPVRHARRAAALTGATVLLKGATTVVTAPGGPVHAQHDATGWLATAGAGDVLAGVLGALLAAHGDDLAAHPETAADVVPRLAAAAALVHGRAARLAAGQPAGDVGPARRAGSGGKVTGGPITAGDVARALPAAVRTLLR